MSFHPKSFYTYSLVRVLARLKPHDHTTWLEYLVGIMARGSKAIREKGIVSLSSDSTGKLMAIIKEFAVTIFYWEGGCKQGGQGLIPFLNLKRIFTASLK